jgi:hypothetical protein
VQVWYSVITTFILSPKTKTKQKATNIRVAHHFKLPVGDDGNEYSIHKAAMKRFHSNKNI